MELLLRLTTMLGFLFLIMTSIVMLASTYLDLDITKITKSNKRAKNSRVKNTDIANQSKIPDYIQNAAEKDAQNDSYRIKYEENSEQQEQYNRAYKQNRKDIVEHFAFYDAEQVFLYDNGELEYKPFLRGQHLTTSAEISEYQFKFVEEKARLEELAEKEKIRIKELGNTLNALYANDYQGSIEPEQFNRIFQLGETSDKAITEKKKFSAKKIIEDNSRKKLYHPSRIVIRSAIEDADENNYKNVFKGIEFADYHERFFARRMSHVKVQAKVDAEYDQKNYEWFSKIPVIKRKIKKKDIRPMPPSIPARFTHFAEREHYTNVYKRTMESFNKNEMQVEFVEEESLATENSLKLT